MDLLLERTMKREEGIFSHLLNDENKELMVTLEHAFQYDEEWEPIIPNGEFVCIRGKHRLEGMDHDFETFEVTGVQGHSKLLFHWGNFNKDSRGCILTGEKIVITPGPNNDLITNSKVSFAKFMKLQEGVDKFLLRVRG